MLTTMFVGFIIFLCGLGMMRLNEENKKLLRKREEWYSDNMASVFEVIYTSTMILGGVGVLVSLFGWMFSFMVCGVAVDTPGIQ